MDKIVGFLGCGNMGSALAIACANSIGGESLLISDLSRSKAEEIAAKIGAKAADTKTIVQTADLLFLAVKPQTYPALLTAIAPLLDARTSKPLLVSMAAGISIDSVLSLGVTCPIMRIMPNTPASVGEALVLYTCSAAVTEEQHEFFLSALSKAGRLEPIAENLIDAASALSGCGPAFVCLFAEALADGAVACGLPRTAALKYAAQTLLGTAKLMLASGTHPAVLKDAVCSPGGTTIQGVRALEEGGLRAAAMNAVIEAYKKTQSLKEKAGEGQ